jgi:short-subunit dehydrogenase
MARQRILITGASSGLGAEMARQFGALGRDLALCARRKDRLDELAAGITAGHPKARVAVRALDVNDHDDVFAAFTELTDQLGGLDRVIVNAGLGKGAPVGTGQFEANRATAMTNFVAALAQCEAALEHFRARGEGHLVVISSMSALRGMPGTITTYAATKAALATLADGIRADLYGTSIRVTTIMPGYIESEMSARSVQGTPLMAGTAAGTRSIVRAIEAERKTAMVPPWPWVPLSLVLKHAPTAVLRRFA